MKLENLGDAIDEVKEIVRKNGKISVRQLDSVVKDYEVNEAAIQAYFMRESGRSVFEYSMRKERPLTRARKRARAIWTTRGKEYWKTYSGTRLKTFESAEGRKHVFIGTRPSKVLVHDLIEVVSGELVSLTTADLRINF